MTTTSYGTATITLVDKGIDPSLIKEYQKTEIDTRKENADILIKYSNGGSFTIATKSHVEVTGRGVKRAYVNGLFEVTTSKLNQLRKKYSVECDF